MEASIDQKQHFLRAQILESGLDPEPFMAYMGTVKNQGEYIKLQNWSLAQLKQVVQDFKQSVNQQIQREQSKINKQAMRGSKEMMTSRIMDTVVKKQKVFYEYDDLWDYEIHTEQQCKKIPKYFQFKVTPEIDFKSWDIKKTGGFLFGLGATNELQITFITNFTSSVVTRKNQDVDWLRQSMNDKFPGSFIPPLDPIRSIQPEDKSGIMKRVKQTVQFLNSLLDFQYLAQNKEFFMFINETDYNKFSAFKAMHKGVKLSSDIGSIESLEGKFKVQISDRVLKFVKQSTNFGGISDQIYTNLQNNIRKVLGDLETLAKHSHYIANDFAKLHDKYTKMSQKCKISDFRQKPQQMPNVLIYLNNVFTTIGNQYKKNMMLLKEISQQFIKYTHAEWRQFLIHNKKYHNELNNYLNLKSNLLKKKERSFNDVSKWQLDEKEQFRMSRINTSTMDKQQAFEIMFPKQNKIESQTRIWQAYINQMYEKSFRALLYGQETRYLKNFGKYCGKMEKVTKEQMQLFSRFKDIFQDQLRKNSQ